MLQLPDVMLCAVTSVAIPETVRALQRSMDDIAFGDAVIFTHADPLIPRGSALRWEHVPRIATRDAYSAFILKHLAPRITRPHILIVQWDGFVVDPAAWDPEFLEHDYVGAPWPQFRDGFAVGNGGFSLRSRRLLEATADDRFVPHHPEDVAICREWRTALEDDFDIRFAPVDVAGRFAFERHRPDGPTFGFHGLFNFPDILPPTELPSVLRALDPSLLRTRDGADLVLKLIEKRHHGLAWRTWLRRPAGRPAGRDIKLPLQLIAASFGLPVSAPADFCTDE